MTDAPKHIWALADRRRYWQGEPPQNGQQVGHWTKYIRTDALPDMIAPLVWDGFRSGPYKIQVYDRGADLWFCGKAIDFDGEHERLLGDHLTMLSVDELKQHANAHHRALIMAAFQTPTITP
jgi:hypothetical protein